MNPSLGTTSRCQTSHRPETELYSTPVRNLSFSTLVDGIFGWLNVITPVVRQASKNTPTLHGINVIPGLCICTGPPGTWPCIPGTRFNRFSHSHSSPKPEASSSGLLSCSMAVLLAQACVFQLGSRSTAPFQDAPFEATKRIVQKQHFFPRNTERAIRGPSAS